MNFSITRDLLPTGFSHVLSGSLSNEHVTSVFWKFRVFGDKAEILAIGRVEATEGHVL